MSDERFIVFIQVCLVVSLVAVAVVAVVFMVH